VGDRVANADLSPLAALRAFRRDPIALLERLATLGDVVRVRIPRGEAYLVNDPELVHEVFVAESGAFRKGPTIEAATLLLGESLLTSEGDAHLRRRRMIQPWFRHDRVGAYAETMVRRAERVSGRWRDGVPFDVRDEMATITLGVVGEALFGTDMEGERGARVTRAMTQALSMFDRVYSPGFRLLVRLPTPSMRRFRRIERELDAVIVSMIAERRSAPGDDDVVSRLLAEGEDGTRLTDRQVRDEALTLVLAGHETTANALAWTWWLLAQHPDAERALHAELDALDGRAPAAADLPDLAFTRAVLSESIRLRPPAWAIGRRAMRAHVVGDVAIPAGAVVVVSPWLLHHDPRWWRDASAFRPERWLRAPDHPRSAFVPFGGGPRMCIGESFARLEGTLVLATIAARWRLRLAPGPPVVPQAVVTLRPRHGIAMAPELRTASRSVRFAG
jgi:cytochrome P450